MNVHRHAGSAFLEAVSHGFFWLVVGNGVGVLLALLLVYPEGNFLLGQWTYGRWVPVHLNLQLFGWTSLPLVAWLLRVYRVDENGLSAAGRAAVWSWSVALGLGAFPWNNGARTLLRRWRDDLQCPAVFGAPFGVSDHGRCSILVAIRMLTQKGRRVLLPAGCGVVAGSRFESEWAELALKRRAVKSGFGAMPQEPGFVEKPGVLLEK